MENNNKAIIYTRVSTKKQEKEGDSLENQKKECRKFCEYNNIQVLGVFSESFTGKQSDRPILRTAIDNAIMNKVNYFIIFDIDRFSREGYEGYSRAKQELLAHNIQLRDSKNIIGEERVVIENEKIDMTQYKWNKENPTEMSEMVYSAQAKIEGNKILQRTITREIQLEQEGYHVRDSNFGFTLQKAHTGKGKGKIQVPDPIEGKWMLEILELKALGAHSSQEIAEKLNLIGAKTRRGNKLTGKYLDTLFIKTVYAGVIVSKWNNYDPIRAKYQGLISIEKWNKINKGKRKIIENNDGSIEYIDYSKIKNEESAYKQKRRKKFDPNLPYRNLVKSSYIKGKLISGSYSNPGRKKPSGYYHPIRKKGEVGENIKKEAFHKTIESFFGEIQINPIIKVLFEDKFDEIFENNKDKITERANILVTRKNNIDQEIHEIEEKVYNLDSNSMRLAKIFDKKLGELELEKSKIELEILEQDKSDYIKPTEFKNFCFTLLEQLGTLLKQSQSLEELSLLFRFVFTETPEYNDILNRTSQLQPIFALNTKKELSKIENSSLNRKWQAHEESNLERRIWSPEL